MIIISIISSKLFSIYLKHRIAIICLTIPEYLLLVLLLVILVMFRSLRQNCLPLRWLMVSSILICIFYHTENLLILIRLLPILACKKTACLFLLQIEWWLLRFNLKNRLSRMNLISLKCLIDSVSATIMLLVWSKLKLLSTFITMMLIIFFMSVLVQLLLLSQWLKRRY